MVKTYDCTDGGYRYEWCRGCYTMTEDKDGQGYWVQKSDYDALAAERDQWKAGSAHVNGALLKRIAELEAALRLVREWADGACPYFDKGREADILGSEAETVAKCPKCGCSYMSDADHASVCDSLLETKVCQHDIFSSASPSTLQWLGSSLDPEANTHLYRCTVCDSEA